MPEREHIRQRIAQECARIIAEEGVSDYMGAKQKASQRLRVEWMGTLPNNDEVDRALAEYHRLYRPATQTLHIRRLRQIALELMQLLHKFCPHLVGHVLDGTAGRFSPITLHLFAHSPEDILATLIDLNIPFAEHSHEVVSANGKTNNMFLPAVRFLFADIHVTLKLFPTTFLHQLPKRNRKELRRGASLKEVRSLINAVVDASPMDRQDVIDPGIQDSATHARCPTTLS